MENVTEVNSLFEISNETIALLIVVTVVFAVMIINKIIRIDLDKNKKY